jgi:hypothetical protein
MPADDHNSPGRLDPTTILALLTVLGGLFLAAHHFSSDRPILPPEEFNDEISEQKFDTRLWQDPFAAVAGKPDIARIGHLDSELARKSDEKPPGGIQILNVMVPVDPSTENKEVRTRIRYAVISALAQAGYNPDRPENIGIWRISNWPFRHDFKKSLRSRNSTNPGAELYAPFEWYGSETPAASQAGQVLVLWLDEDSFNDYPAQRLQVFMNKLGAHLQAGSESKISVSTIGPFYSSTLKALIEDVQSNNAGVPGSSKLQVSKSKLFVAVPRAVARVLVTNANLSPKFGSRQNVLEILKKANGFSNVTDMAVTDWHLAGEAFEALRDRGIDLTNTSNHLVLVTDQDSFTGQTLAKAYERKLHLEEGGARDHPPPNLHVYNYLKGLDGQDLTGKESIVNTNSSAQGPNQEAKRIDTWKFDVNRAEGPNQLDYLERLALKIERLERDLKTSNATVKVIGIGGGDVYDTLLILQAIRPHFRDAVFFSTDLDARLWSPQQWEWTHNLLVFSGYGLSLNDELQSHIGGFRDSRQTAIYTAALAALGDVDLLARLPNFSKMPPRRFEIGRTGPLDLSVSDPSHLHPTPAAVPARTKRKLFGCIVVLLFCGIILSVFLSTNARTFTLEEEQYLAEPLWLREEDIGGVRGMWHLENAALLDIPLPPGGEHSSTPPAIIDRVTKILNEPEAGSEKDNLRAAKLDFQPADILSPQKIGDVLRNPPPKSIYEKLSPNRGGNAQLAQSEAVQAIELANAFNELIRNPPAHADPVTICRENAEQARWLLRPNTWGLVTANPRARQQLRVLRRLILQDLFSGMVKSLPMTMVLLEDVHQLLHEINTALTEGVEMTPGWIRRSIKRIRDLLAKPAESPSMPAKANIGSEIKRGREGFQVVDSVTLDALIGNRFVFGQWLKEKFDRYYREATEPEKDIKADIKADRRFGVPVAASQSMDSAWTLYKMRRFRLRMYQLLVLPLVIFGLASGFYWLAGRESIENGQILAATNARPTIYICALTVLLAVVFFMESHMQLRMAAVYTSRLFRLPYPAEDARQNGAAEILNWRLWPYLKMRIRRSWDKLVPCSRKIMRADSWASIPKAIHRIFLPCVPAPLGFVEASEMWLEYNRKARRRYRFSRAAAMAVAYLVAVWALMAYLGEDMSWVPPLPSLSLRHVFTWVEIATLCAFLLLTFWTVDAACLCRWFIQQLTEGPTLYPEATLKYFGDLRGRIDDDALAEFIDVKIIAEITDRVGLMLYFPAIILFLMLLAYNTFTFVWPWRPSWILIMFCHFAVALLSMVILQNSAKRARDACVASLEAKIQQARSAHAATDQERTTAALTEGEKLLEEMRGLRSGAFVGFAGNPVVGALLVPSGGTVVLELIRYFLEK